MTIRSWTIPSTPDSVVDGYRQRRSVAVGCFRATALNTAGAAVAVGDHGFGGCSAVAAVAVC